jgi:hypothetical protein
VGHHPSDPSAGRSLSSVSPAPGCGRPGVDTARQVPPNDETSRFLNLGHPCQGKVMRRKWRSGRAERRCYVRVRKERQLECRPAKPGWMGPRHQSRDEEE